METTLRHSDIAATCVQYTTNTLAIIFPAYCSFSLSSTTECTVRVAVVVLCCNLVGCCCCSWWYWVGRVSSFPYLRPIEVPALLRLIDKRRHRTIHATIYHMQGNGTIDEYYKHHGEAAMVAYHEQLHREATDKYLAAF